MPCLHAHETAVRIPTLISDVPCHTFHYVSRLFVFRQSTPQHPICSLTCNFIQITHRLNTSIKIKSLNAFEFDFVAQVPSSIIEFQLMFSLKAFCNILRKKIYCRFPKKRRINVPLISITYGFQGVICGYLGVKWFLRELNICEFECILSLLHTRHITAHMYSRSFFIQL